MKKKIIKSGKRFFKNKNDPLGSYTGTPTDGDKPVQDADDL